MSAPPAPARPLLLLCLMLLMPLSCDVAAKGLPWLMLEVDDPVLYAREKWVQG